MFDVKNKIIHLMDRRFKYDLSESSCVHLDELDKKINSGIVPRQVDMHGNWLAKIKVNEDSDALNNRYNVRVVCTDLINGEIAEWSNFDCAVLNIEPMLKNELKELERVLYADDDLPNDYQDWGHM